MNHLMNSELRNDKLQMFNQAWEETLAAIKIELDVALLEGLYRGQLDKPTIMNNASAPYQSDRVRRKESQSKSQFKALVTDILDQQQEALKSQKKESSSKRRNSSGSLHER